ncbi:hypothetical protein LOTGIDRAFT_166254 [Lottia gigantea]|uniref:Uncharacterized protein n=1 Tax=Lottia gigantea TaxID=225164 RepID=V4BFH4_LOTGI|nr:hypothetical protein LOTGIDRAFT_166254 [Lottia gigantea]ESO87674.1 hypothetical protein LOTGIDRAFT_166254 [Lottia gigantea]
MEEPAVRSCLLDMLSVTDTAVNSIRKNPSPKSNNSNNPDVSCSQSSSVSQESCKESVGGSTTVSEVLIASTNVARCELDDKPLPKQVTVVRHNGMTIKSDVDVIKSQNTLLRMLSDSSYDDEGKENLPMEENVNDSIVSVEGRITISSDRKTDSRKDRFLQVDRNHNVKKNQGVESETCSSARTTTGSSIQDDVKIEQFHLTDKQKSLRQLLGKKSDQSGPVKRVIHPKLLQKQEPVQKMCKKDEGCVSKEMLAASVAASAAAAVAQPFFQKEFEDKIHQTYHLVKNNPQSTEDSDKRIEELEKKVSVLNEQRIDHLEKLQQYQMEIQTQMLSQPCKQTNPSYHSAKPGVISVAPGVDRPSQLSPPRVPSTVYFPRQAPQPKHYSYPSEHSVDPSYPREPPTAAYFPRDYPHASRAREPIYPGIDQPGTSKSRDPLYSADFQRDHPQSRDISRREPSPNVIYPREDNRPGHIPRNPTSRAHFQRSPPPQDGRGKYFPARDRSFSPSRNNEPAFKISPKKASQVKLSPSRAQSSKYQQSKRKSPPRQEVKYFPRKREQPKRSPVKNKERKDSPLDTPAPRTRVPTPMVYDDEVSHTSDPRFNYGGLLEEIMEKNRSPSRPDKDTTFSVPDDTQYNRLFTYFQD